MKGRIRATKHTLVRSVHQDLFTRHGSISLQMMEKWRMYGRFIELLSKISENSRTVVTSKLLKPAFVNLTKPFESSKVS